jgi:hypothetical protein
MRKYLMLVLAIIPTLVFAEGSRPEKLLNRLWRDLKDNNSEAISKYTSKKFQSVHMDGGRNKWQELNLIKTLDIGSYVISDLKITKSGEEYIMTYFVTIQPKEDGSLPTTSARLTTFKKINDHWKWLTHANLPEPIA